MNTIKLTDEHLQDLRRTAVIDNNTILVELCDNAAFTMHHAYRLAVCEYLNATSAGSDTYVP